MQQGQTVDQFLDSIHQSADSPKTKQVWDSVKNQPPEQIVQTGRKLFYGVVSRALAGDPATLEELQQNPELLAEVEAYIECCFKKAEESSISTASSRRASSLS